MYLNYLKLCTFVALVALTLLMFGFFIEGLATVLLLIPTLRLIAWQMGIHPVYFGMAVVLANVLFTMTPPVAVHISAASSVTKLSVEGIVKSELPLFVAMIPVILAVVFVPLLSTFML